MTSTGSPDSAVVPENKARTAIGLDANVAAAVAYVLGWISGVALLLLEHDNRFVRFHAMQSTIVFAGLSFAWFLCFSVPFLGWLVSIFVIPPVSALLWLLLIFKAYQGERFKLPVVGDMAAQLDDVRAFFQTYYRPCNASLALAGDIETAQALTLAERYFGEIDAGSPPPPVEASAPPPIVGDVRLLIEDRVELPRLYVAWHSPPLFAAGDAELDLASDVLAGGKTSRLYRALVYEQRIATEVAASQSSRELGSFFQLVATAAPGRSLTELERAMTTEVSRLIDPELVVEIEVDAVVDD